MLETIAVGPFGIYYANLNTPMNLPLHTHYAEVTICFTTLGQVGFPAFEGTYECIRRRLKHFTEKPFEGVTNESICRQLFHLIDGWTDPEIDRWGGKFALKSVELAVRGVRDDIGHPEGMTRYRVEV
jgi:hypothetical protein